MTLFSIQLESRSFVFLSILPLYLADTISSCVCFWPYPASSLHGSIHTLLRHGSLSSARSLLGVASFQGGTSIRNDSLKSCSHKRTVSSLPNWSTSVFWWDLTSISGKMWSCVQAIKLSIKLKIHWCQWVAEVFGISGKIIIWFW